MGAGAQPEEGRVTSVGAGRTRRRVGDFGQGMRTVPSVSPISERAGVYRPMLKLALTSNTAFTMAKAMKPTKKNTVISTPLAITLVNVLS